MSGIGKFRKTMDRENSKRLEDKVILVTGAASGIGEATVRRMVAEGGKVVIADYAKQRAEELALELQNRNADVKAAYFSAADLDSCKDLVDFTIQGYGRIDVLVNNVGGTNLKRDGNIENMEIDYFDEAFHINLRCAVYLSQLVIPGMEEQKGGNIVNIASIGGLTADFQGTYYGAAKAGVINLTRYIATQVGKKNIRCNAIAPGLILTPAALNNLPEDMQKLFLRHNALPYLGKPEDIAAAVAFLASEDARYVTGQTIVIDGGLTVHNPTVADIVEMKK